MLTYPQLPGLTPTVVWRPLWSGEVQQHQSGAEFRVSYWAEPLWEFDYSYELLRSGPRVGQAWDELQQLVGLFNASQGTTFGFRLFNPDDNQVFRQLVGTGDGATTTFDLVRTYGANNPTLGYDGTEHVGFVDTTKTFNVYLDAATGPLAPNSYSVSTATPVLQQIVFVAAPGAGRNIYVDMSYLYYARFKESSQDFQMFMTKLWSLQKVTLRTLRSEPAT